MAKGGRSRGSRAFKTFFSDINILTLIVAVAVGEVARDFVLSFVHGIIMPLVNLIWQVENWKDWKVPLAGTWLKVGEPLANLIVLLVTLGLVFFAAKALLERNTRG